MTLNRSYTYIAFYDLDHTILQGNSATYLVEEARQLGVMTQKQYRHAVFLSILYKLNLGNPTKMINRMLTWLKGLPEESLRKLCHDVFKDSLVDIIRPEILLTLEKHRKQDCAVVLLSSASILICEPVSKHLGFEDAICTQLGSDNGILNGATKGKLVYAKEKKHRLLSYCEEQGYDPKDAFYYGDSFTDHYVMEAVGHPVAVSPDRKLLKIATAKNWPILVPDR